MCKWGTDKIVEVTMPPCQPYHPTEWKKKVGIDSCISELVEVFESVGLRMLASCCGHGKGDGAILLDTPHKDFFYKFIMTKSFYKWYEIGEFVK